MLYTGNLKANVAVLCLHGWQQDADDFREHINTLITKVQLDAFQTVLFFPQAISYEWFAYNNTSSFDYDENSLNKSKQYIDRLVHTLKKTYKSVLLVGYSQGACMALSYAASCNQLPLLAISGFFMSKSLVFPGVSDNKKMRVNFFHGKNDKIIHLNLALKSYKDMNIEDFSIQSHDHWNFWSNAEFKRLFLRFLQKHTVTRKTRITKNPQKNTTRQLIPICREADRKESSQHRSRE